MTTLTILAIAAILAAVVATIGSIIGQDAAYDKGAIRTAITIGYAATAIIPILIAVALGAGALVFLS
jgi:hypothetical protein